MTRRLVPLLVLAVAAGPLAAQPPAFPPPSEMYKSTIHSALTNYTSPAIQAELKLTDEQKAKLDKIPDDLMAKHKEAIDKELNAGKEAAEKQAKAEAERVKQFDALLEKNLTADQRKRLGQLAVQLMGQGAFSDPEVFKALGFKESPGLKLAEFQDAGFTKLNKEFPNFSPFNSDPDTRQKYFAAQQKINTETMAAFVATFTDEQKKTWKELNGQPSQVTMPLTGFGNWFPPGSRYGYLDSLVGNEKALDELKVEKAARTALADGVKALTPASPAWGPGGPGGFGGVRQSLYTTLRTEATALADDVLTPAQAKRLGQIRFQMRGIGVFTPSPFAFSGGPGGPGTPTGILPNPLMKLTLTPAQVVKIDAILADATKQQSDLPFVARPAFGGGGFPTEPLTDDQKKAVAERVKKSADINAKALADIVGTFDAGQTAVWKDLTGEPSDAAKTTNQAFGGGPAFAGGGFGGPGGRPGMTILTLWLREAAQRRARGEYAAALAVYDDAIRLAPTNPDYLMNKANLLATCPSEWVRDGKLALELVKKAMAETKEPTSFHYQVLASAHAECGQFDEAVKAEEKALELIAKYNANDPRAFDDRLKLYRDKKPFRLTPPAPAPTAPPGDGR